MFCFQTCHPMFFSRNNFFRVFSIRSDRWVGKTQPLLMEQKFRTPSIVMYSASAEVSVCEKASRWAPGKQVAGPLGHHVPPCSVLLHQPPTELVGCPILGAFNSNPNQWETLISKCTNNQQVGFNLWDLYSIHGMFCL